VDDHHRLDLVLAIGFEPYLEVARVRAAPPIAGQVVNLKAESFRSLSPALREMASLKHHNVVARRERLNNRYPPAT
jgi:hypothetical protein